MLQIEQYLKCYKVKPKCIRTNLGILKKYILRVKKSIKYDIKPRWPKRLSDLIIIPQICTWQKLLNKSEKKKRERDKLGNIFGTIIIGKK